MSRLQLHLSAPVLSVAVFFALTHSNCFVNHGASATAQEFVYPGQAKSERDLSTCEPYEICSVVHNRYWFPNKVERLCRCDGQECSSGWSESADAPDWNYTMTLNNRAQMKFCEPVTALPECLQSDESANKTTTTTTTTTTPLVSRFLNVVNETRTEILDNATAKNYKLASKAECYCSPHNTWIAHTLRKNKTSAAVSYTWTSYRCSALTKCKPGDVCGFERTDHYSNYYKCSCPYGYLCLRQNQSVIHQVNEMLYEGPAFATSCQRQSKHTRNTDNYRVGFTL